MPHSPAPQIRSTRPARAEVVGSLLRPPKLEGHEDEAVERVVRIGERRAVRRVDDVELQRTGTLAQAFGQFLQHIHAPRRHDHPATGLHQRLAVCSPMPPLAPVTSAVEPARLTRATS